MPAFELAEAVPAMSSVGGQGTSHVARIRGVSLDGLVVPAVTGLPVSAGGQRMCRGDVGIFAVDWAWYEVSGVRRQPVGFVGVLVDTWEGWDDKSGQWSSWYRRAIPEAERSYELYLKEREAEAGS